MHLENRKRDIFFNISESREKRANYGFVHLSDKEIWAQFKSGNEGAFIYIYEHYFDQLVNFSFQFTQDVELIKDTIQDLFIYIRNRRSNLSNTDSIKLYLYKCCRNNLLNAIKKLHKDQKANSLEDHLFLPVDSEEQNIINLQTQDMNRKSIKKAIAKLSVREREIIYYFYFEDLSYKDIADLLEYKEVKSVRSLLYKAINKLRGLIITLASLFIFFCRF